MQFLHFFAFLKYNILIIRLLNIVKVRCNMKLTQTEFGKYWGLCLEVYRIGYLVPEKFINPKSYC